MKWMNRVTHWFCDLKLGKKIFYIFIISFLIPLIVVQGVMLYVISNHMRNKVNELMFSQLAQIEERTNLALEVYTNLVYQIYSDNEIIEDIIRYTDSEEEKEK